MLITDLPCHQINRIRASVLQIRRPSSEPIPCMHNKLSAALRSSARRHLAHHLLYSSPVLYFMSLRPYHNGFFIICSLYNTSSRFQHWIGSDLTERKECFAHGSSFGTRCSYCGCTRESRVRKRDYIGFVISCPLLVLQSDNGYRSQVDGVVLQ